MRRLASAISCLAFSHPASGGDIARAILGFPGKAFAHGVELAEVAEMTGQEPSLAGIPCPLDELDDRAGKTMRHASQDHAEGSG